MTFPTTGQPNHHAAPGGGSPAGAAERRGSSLLAEEDPGPPLGRRISRVVLRASVVGVAVSLLVHVVMLAVAAIWHVGVAQAGGAGPRDDSVEFALLTDEELLQLQQTGLQLDTPSVTEAAMERLPTEDPLAGAASEGDPGSQGDLGTLAEGMGGAGGEAVGEGLELSGSGSGAASFFGVEAQGSRFVYIVDVSGSMVQPMEKFAAVKIELQESVGALMEHVNFYIIWYSSEAFPIGGRSKWIEASDAGKKWALNQINEQQAFGGTVPWPAFLIALEQLKPRPDAVYFMTDGQFDPFVREEIARINAGSRKIPIHCIAFGADAAHELMEGIAKDSGGNFRSIEGPR